MEDSYARWVSKEVQERLALVPYEVSRCAYMVHSVPKDKVKDLVQQLQQRGKYLFVTDLYENYYVQFGTCWQEFAEAMLSSNS